MFDEPAVARVRLTYGDSPLGAREMVAPEIIVADVAAPDDFLYGEPQLIPAD